MGNLPEDLIRRVQAMDGNGVAAEIASMALQFPGHPFEPYAYDELKADCRRMMAEVRKGGMFNTSEVIYWPRGAGIWRVNFQVSNITSDTSAPGMYMRINAIDGGKEFHDNWGSIFSNEWVLVTPAAPAAIAAPVYRAPEVEPDSSSRAPEPASEPPVVQRSFGQKLGLLMLTVLAVLAAILMAGVAIGTLIHDKDRFAIGIVSSIGLAVIIMVTRLARDRGIYDVTMALVALGLVAFAGLEWSLQMASPLVFMAALCHGVSLCLIWFMDRMPANRKPSLHVGWIVLAFYLAQGLITYLAG